MLIGAIEAGGTKCSCGIFEIRQGEKPQLVIKTDIPTKDPTSTLAQIASFFISQPAIKGLGIGCFGPVDLHKKSPTWGYITSTPKTGWQNIAFAPYFQEKLGVQIALDTDVNAAALAERYWGKAKNIDDFMYITIGTGIGGGIFTNGNLIHGYIHPELGHIKLAPLAGDNYSGICPFHGNCFEGVASGSAIFARWGTKAENLSADHPAWDLEARYIAKAFATYYLVLSTRRIILGGGVGRRPGLAEKVIAYLAEELGSYVPAMSHTIMADFVHRPALGDLSGLYGAAALFLADSSSQLT